MTSQLATVVNRSANLNFSRDRDTFDPTGAFVAARSLHEDQRAAFVAAYTARWNALLANFEKYGF